MIHLRLTRRIFQLRALFSLSRKKRRARSEFKRKARVDRLRYTKALAKSDCFWMIEFPLRMAAIQAELSVAQANSNIKSFRKRA